MSSQGTPRHRGNSRDLIDGSTVFAFITSVMGARLDSHVSRKVNGLRLDGQHPSIWSVDALMVAAGRHLDELFVWAESNNRRLWVHGEPEWHKQEPDWAEIDKTWPDQAHEQQTSPGLVLGELPQT